MCAYMYVCKCIEMYIYIICIFFNGDWMEVLGCGVIHDEFMANTGTYIMYLLVFLILYTYV
jgi:phenylalanyl-tRNA synthetase alpha subunit